MIKLYQFFPSLTVFLVVSCAGTPSGPSWMALPNLDKSFDQFRKDDYQCRQFAYEQTSGTYFEEYSDYINQRRYDSSYIKCMYAQGHHVPVFGPIPESLAEDPTRTQSGGNMPPPSEESQLLPSN